MKQKTRPVNWDTLIDDGTVQYIKAFANGSLSARFVSGVLKNTGYAGEFRNLIRSGGVARAKSLTKKALKRRELL